MTYAIYGRWDHGTAIDSATVKQINAEFRIGDESVCVWVDANEPSVLCISLDVAASTDDAAIAAGRSALDDAVGIASLAGHPVSITATTETGMINWSP